MTTQRNVTVNLTSGTATEIAVEINSWDKLHAAIGYLSMWAVDAYPNVLIIRDSGADLLGIYYDADNNHKYTIGAVWHGDHYGFHS